MKKLRAMSLKTRAMLVTTGILLLVLAFNTVVNVSVASSRYREALIGRTAALAESIQKDINKAIGFGLPLNALEGMGDKLRGVKEADKDLSSALIMDTEGRVLYASVQSIEHTVLVDAASKAALAATGPLVQFFADDTGGHYEKVLPLMGIDGKKIGVFRIALRKESVNQQVQYLIWSSLGVGCVSFLIAIVLVYFFMDRQITKPIMEMSETARLMAAGDLSHELAVRGETEIADLGVAINAMSRNLRGMLNKIRNTVFGVNEAMTLMVSATNKMSEGAGVQQEATEQTAMVVNKMVVSNRSIAENAEAMFHATTDASSSATEMAASIAEVARNASALASVVDETSSSIEQMIASIKQVSENIGGLSVSAEQTSSSVAEMGASVKEVEQRAVESARLAEKVSGDASERGMVTAGEAIKGMQNIKEAVEATAEALNRLGKRSQEIGQILKVIDEVTEQTSLLALNAAILASQAGEHGKGFAVVAEEIKDLAERTSASTQEISDIVRAVREETAKSVQAMSRGLRAVETGVDLVNVTSDMLEQVTDSSRRSAEMARAIEKATAEQAKSVAQITETSMNVAEQVEQIADALREQREGSERIAQATERMRDFTQQVKQATQEQMTGSRQIAKAVESVTQQASLVARSTSEQSDGAQHISAAISRIHKITQDTVEVSIEMKRAEQTLKQKADILQAELASFKV